MVHWKYIFTTALVLWFRQKEIYILYLCISTSKMVLTAITQWISEQIKKKVSLLSREDYSVSREVQAEGLNEICILVWSHWVTDLFSSVLHHQPLLVPLITQWEMFCWKWIISSIRKRCFITHTSNVRSLFPSPLLEIKISLDSKRNHFQQQVF